MKFMHEALWVTTGIMLFWSVANLVLAAVDRRDR